MCFRICIQFSGYEYYCKATYRKVPISEEYFKTVRRQQNEVYCDCWLHKIDCYVLAH